MPPQDPALLWRSEAMPTKIDYSEKGVEAVSG
jgi:hypothetical protein